MQIGSNHDDQDVVLHDAEPHIRKIESAEQVKKDDNHEGGGDLTTLDQ